MSHHFSILQNLSNGLFHPIIFRPSPRPSEDPKVGDYCHHKSMGHHTDGFATLHEAERYILEREDAWPTGDLIAWDGEGIPAMISSYPYFAPINVPAAKVDLDRLAQDDIEGANAAYLPQ